MNGIDLFFDFVIENWKATITESIAENHSIECTSESEQIGSCFILRLFLFSKLKNLIELQGFGRSKTVTCSQPKRSLPCAMLIEQLSWVLWKKKKENSDCMRSTVCSSSSQNRNNERIMSKTFSAERIASCTHLKANSTASHEFL